MVDRHTRSVPLCLIFPPDGDRDSQPPPSQHVPVIRSSHDQVLGGPDKDFLQKSLSHEELGPVLQFSQGNVPIYDLNTPLSESVPLVYFTYGLYPRVILGAAFVQTKHVVRQHFLFG